MPTIVQPYIPQYITVHMGPPDSDAENVTVTFPEYIKNVASSEIYPTWEPAALKANLLAITSFALNRIYTEFYTSRGYPFHITASTAYDQKFIKGRNLFENISLLADQCFNCYLRRRGFQEPLAAKFCNGTTVVCDGLSQWGSQSLALEGRNAMEILRRYYGEDILLVTDAPVMDSRSSYPGSPLRRGSTGESVFQLQIMLNRIAGDYPAIPLITPADGIFGPETERTVRRFQQIFQLTEDGIVGNATWYKAVYLYVGIMDLAELLSQGQTFDRIWYPREDVLSPGDIGEEVRLVQALLSAAAEFHRNLPPVSADGIYGEETRNGVLALQRLARLPRTGIVDEATWEALYRICAGIADTAAEYRTLLPELFQRSPRNTPIQFSGQVLQPGDQDSRGGVS